MTIVLGVLLLAVICFSVWLQMRVVRWKEKLIRENQILERRLSAATTITCGKALQMGAAIESATDPKDLARTILWEQLGLENQVADGWQYQNTVWDNGEIVNKDNIANAKTKIRELKGQIEKQELDLTTLDKVRTQQTRLVNFFLTSDK